VAARPILVAPDKFKQTLSAADVGAAVGRGLIDAGVERVELLPLADGGEGTMDALMRAVGGRTLTAEVADPLGRPVRAAFALLGDGRTAVVEMAQASGLWRLDPGELDAPATTTRGTGELMRAAVESGARELIVTAGGSATTDGGRGALEALGARFGARRAHLEELRPLMRGVKLSVACDVRNPLLGADGAARAFAPQKGASPDQVDLLEQRLAAWARLAARTTGRDPSDEPMAGAAGGLAGGLWAFAGAALRPGAALVLDLAGFDARMRASHAVVTGEGRIDEQTLHGKAVFEIATRCRQAGVPCYAVVGVDALDAFGKRLLNIEVEAAARDSRTADAADVERAARRVAKRLSYDSARAAGERRIKRSKDAGRRNSR
jgi:glycerate kinase